MILLFNKVSIMQSNSSPVTQERIIWIDWMRVLACFMVMVVHSTEPFYFGGEGSLIRDESDAFWVAFFDSIVRCCVPLFVIASSYLLFPLKISTGEFVRRRAVRILIPFVIWSVFYAFYWGDPASNLRDLVFNFNYSAGHLWFVYMLIGIYMLMPILSPWAERVKKKELTWYLAIWFFTTLIPLFRDWLNLEPLAITYGPTGIPRQAPFPLWGEASWNTYGTFYYVSGFIGYLLLGLWLRKFGDSITRTKSFLYGIPSLIVGFTIVIVGFLRRVYITGGGNFPVGRLIDDAIWWETTWVNDTIGVALMTIGLVFLMKNITANGVFYKSALIPISQASYGMYLGHMVVLAALSSFFRATMDSTPLIIISTAVCSFITVAVVAVALRRIPVIGRYLV